MFIINSFKTIGVPWSVGVVYKNSYSILLYQQLRIIYTYYLKNSSLFCVLTSETRAIYIISAKSRQRPKYKILYHWFRFVDIKRMLYVFCNQRQLIVVHLYTCTGVPWSVSVVYRIRTHYVFVNRNEAVKHREAHCIA